MPRQASVTERYSCRYTSSYLRLEPEPFDKDVIEDPAAAVHADGDLVLGQRVNPAGTGKLRPLIGVADLGRRVPSQRPLKGAHAEVALQGIAQFPGQHETAKPVHQSKQEHKAAGQADVGDVAAPDLVAALDRQAFEQVRKTRVGAAVTACAYRRESGLFLPKRKWTTFLAQELLAASTR